MKKYKIGEIFDIEKGTLQSSKNIPGDYDFITASSEWKTHKDYTHDKEALIFAMGASGSLGRTHYVNGKFISSDLCFILSPKPEFDSVISLKLYYYYFNYNREEIVKAIATGTSKLAINMRNFSNYEISLPENQEDLLSKIVGIERNIESLKELTAENKKLVEDLRKKRTNEIIEGTTVLDVHEDRNVSDLLTQLNQKKKNLIESKMLKRFKMKEISSENLPFSLPAGWQWVRIGEIAEVVEYGTSTKADSAKGDVPVLRMNNIIQGEVDYKNLKYVPKDIKDLPRLFLKKNDILFNRTNSLELVGKSAVFNGESDTYTFASYLIRLTVFKEVALPEYIVYYLNSEACRKTQIDPYVTKQNGQANFNGSKLKEIIVPLPSIEVQQHIVDDLNKNKEICNILLSLTNEKIQDTDDLMKKFLSEVFAVKHEITI